LKGPKRALCALSTLHLTPRQFEASTARCARATNPLALSAIKPPLFAPGFAEQGYARHWENEANVSVNRKVVFKNSQSMRAAQRNASSAPTSDCSRLGWSRRKTHGHATSDR